MIEQNDVNHAHNDRISKMAQFEELTRELQDYAYCLGYNRCMDVNDALRAENTILREALGEAYKSVLQAHSGDYWQEQYSDNIGVCVCDQCEKAREALQRAGE